MKYEVRPINDKQAETFYADFKDDKTFNQTMKFKQFREKVGEKMHVVGVFDLKNEKIVGLASIQEIKRKLGSFLHVPHGPLVNQNHKPEAFEAFLGWYKDFGKQLGVDYVRLSPLAPLGYADLLAEHKYRSAMPYMVNPERTLTLDLTQSEDELLAQMSKTTRYEVRQGIKKGIIIKQGNEKEDVRHFWDLHEETFARQGFTPFAKANTEKEMEVFGADAQIFTAFDGETPLASSLILFDSAAGYYHQGASVRSKLPAPAATLWAAILESKKRGLKSFNFWGLSEANNKNHPWYGLSKFKRGFGGKETEYVHAHDFGLTWKYGIVRAVESYRRRKKGY